MSDYTVAFKNGEKIVGDAPSTLKLTFPETYLEDAYNDDEELKDDMKHTLKKLQKIEEIEEELLKEIDK